MLPWHAIPFLKGLGMLTPNPWENGWPRLWRSCNWQKNTQLNHSMAPKEPYRESKWADVSPLLKYISGAVCINWWSIPYFVILCLGICNLCDGCNARKKSHIMFNFCKVVTYALLFRNGNYIRKYHQKFCLMIKTLS